MASVTEQPIIHPPVIDEAKGLVSRRFFKPDLDFDLQVPINYCPFCGCWFVERPVNVSKCTMVAGPYTMQSFCQNCGWEEYS
jgi:hypothetical protein